MKLEYDRCIDCRYDECILKQKRSLNMYFEALFLKKSGLVSITENFVQSCFIGENWVNRVSVDTKIRGGGF